jgi:hypothetical protein
VLERLLPVRPVPPILSGFLVLMAAFGRVTRRPLQRFRECRHDLINHEDERSDCAVTYHSEDKEMQFPPGLTM